MAAGLRARHSPPIRRSGNGSVSAMAGKVGYSSVLPSLKHRPRFVAVAGVTAYRTAFGRPKAVVGPQDEHLGAARLWILPNPSGLNASWPTPRLVAAYRELKMAVGDQ